MKKKYNNIKQYFNKGVSTTAGILIVVSIAIVAGGLITWQMCPKEEVPTPSPTVSPTPTTTPTSSSFPTSTSPTGDASTTDETANWKIYTNEEYGYEIKYPSQVENIMFFEEDNTISLDINYYMSQEIAQQMLPDGFFNNISGIPEKDGKIRVGQDYVQVYIKENFDQMNIEKWIQKHESCGYSKGNELNMDKVVLENCSFAGVSGIRIKNLGTCPPGASFVSDIVYLPHNNRIYSIRLLENGGWLHSSLRDYFKTEREHNFDQILSAFKFID